MAARREAFATEMDELQALVGGRASVPKEHVYPKFDAIATASNLPMYWPSRAYDPSTGAPANTWQYNPGGAGCQDSLSCEFPRDTANSRLQPIPNGEQRVVLVVIGGLNAASE